MELYQVLILFVCAALFGFIAKILTADEKNIYKKRRYFPTFKVILFLGALISFRPNQNLAFILLSMLIMVLFWDYETPNKRKTK
jgi:Ca2+/Na+ antiporter